MSINNNDTVEEYEPVPAATPRHWFYQTESNVDRANFLTSLFQSFEEASDYIARALESELITEKGRKKLNEAQQMTTRYHLIFKRDDAEGRFNKELAVTILESNRNIVEKIRDFLEHGVDSKIYKAFQ